MKKLIFAVSILVFSGSALAWNCPSGQTWSTSAGECVDNAPPTPRLPPAYSQGQGQTQGQGQNQGQGQSQDASNHQSQDASNHQSQDASNHQGQSQNANNHQSQNADATNEGNNQSTTFEDRQVRQPVNTAIAGFGQTTAPCRYTNGAGVQTFPAGVSFGFSFRDKDCKRDREEERKFTLAQYLYGQGQRAAGDKVMCSVADIKEALGSDCLTVIGVVQAPPAPALPPQVIIPPVSPHQDMSGYATKEELRRAFTKSVGK